MLFCTDLNYCFVLLNPHTIFMQNLETVFYRIFGVSATVFVNCVLVA